MNEKKLMASHVYFLLRNAAIPDMADIWETNWRYIEENTELVVPLLNKAAAFNAVKCAEFLLSKLTVAEKTNIHECSRNIHQRYQAIHLAAAHGNYEIAELLLKHEVGQLTVRHIYGGDVIHLAAWYGQHLFLKKLVESGKVEVVKKSIQTVWKKNRRSDKEEEEEGTALIAAVRNGKAEMVKYLVELADELGINILDFQFKSTGYTALHEAAIFGHVDIAEYLATVCPELLERRCKKTKSTCNEELTPCDLARLRGQNGIVAVLEDLPGGSPCPTLKEVLLKYRYFNSWETFKNNIGNLETAFSIFSPLTGDIGRENRGAMPWSFAPELVSATPRRKRIAEKNSRTLGEVVRMAIVSVVAMFEQYILELFHETADRAFEVNFMPDVLMELMLSKCGDANYDKNLKALSIAAKYELYCIGEMGEHCRKFYKQQGQFHFDEAKKRFQANLSPELNRFWEALEKNLKCFTEEGLSKYPYKNSHKSRRCFIFVDGKKTPTPLMLTSEEAIETLEKLARLYYGLRCILAHGCADRTVNSTLNGVSFDPSNFGGAEKVSSYFNDLKNRVANEHRHFTMEYFDYVNCLRVYKFMAMLLHCSVMTGLQLWVIEDIAETEDSESASDYALEDQLF